MKTNIRTTQLDYHGERQREVIPGPQGRTYVAEFDEQHVIHWASDGAIAAITVGGKDSAIVADALRRYLLHKFPLIER